MFLLLGPGGRIAAALAGAALLVFGLLSGRPIGAVIGAAVLILAGFRTFTNRRPQ